MNKQLTPKQWWLLNTAISYIACMLLLPVYVYIKTDVTWGTVFMYPEFYFGYPLVILGVISAFFAFLFNRR